MGRDGTRAEAKRPPPRRQATTRDRSRPVDDSGHSSRSRASRAVDPPGCPSSLGDRFVLLADLEKNGLSFSEPAIAGL